MQKQLIARDEKALAIAKLNKRKADTRRKIELGGLIINAGMDGYNKSIILGALCKEKSNIDDEPHYKEILEAVGENKFMNRE